MSFRCILASISVSLLSHSLLDFLLVDSLRMFSNEDVTIGSWMLAMNVHHEDNRAVCDPRCTPTSIAVWDIPRCSGKTILLKFPCYYSSYGV